MTNNSDNNHWTSKNADLWSSQPQQISHGLNKHPLFLLGALADLIDHYPREHYSLIHMGPTDGKREWREGDIGGATGGQVIEAISRGRMWLNLRNVSGIDTRHRALLDEIFDNLSQKMPGFYAPTRQSGILISSPAAQVYYHCDMPGQMLFQMHGTKRVYVYPNRAPFVMPEHLENIALFDLEVGMPYDSTYDRRAQVFDLKPGQFLSWPLNAPHRVQNVEGVNISMSISYTSPEIRRGEVVHLANGLLRHRLGLNPRSCAITGPGYWGKAILQRALRNSTWVRRERSARRGIEFRLDKTRPGEILEMAGA
jgi:hypothetical protein